MIYLKNIDTVDHTYKGQLIQAGQYFLVEPEEVFRFANDSLLLADLASGKMLVAKDDTGNSDIVDLAEQINHLKGTLVEIARGEVVVDKGKKTFETYISHNFCDNTSWASNSTFVFKPASGNVMDIPKAEVQFSHDVALASQTTPGEMYFDTWVYNPLFNPQNPQDPDDESFVPGVSSGNPLHFLYERKVFKGLKDVFDLGNDHYTMNANVDGIPGVTTVRFDYDQLFVLKSSQGAEIRVSLKDDQPMDGNFCTVSLVAREYPE